MSDSFIYEINGQKFEFDREPTENDIDKAAEQMRTESLVEAGSTAERDASSIGSALQKATGIQQRPGFMVRMKDNIIGAIPSAYQFAGGMAAGGAALVATKNPAAASAASAVGGTAGRGYGRIVQQGINQFLEDPIPALGRALAQPMIRGVINQMTPEEKRLFGQEMQTTAVTEAVVAPISLVAGELFTAFGNNFLKEVLGRDVAERGAEKGFKKILKTPTDKIPGKTVTKLSQWFNKLLNVTGEGVKKSVKNSTSRINGKAIKEGADSILPKGISINDWDASPAQKKLVKRALKIVKSLPDDASVEEVWLARRKVDDILYNNSFKQEPLKYLNNLRALSNNPIKEASEEVAKNFGRYNNVRRAQTSLGRHFQSLEVDDQPFAIKAEAFSKSLFSGRKGELTGFLKGVDNFLDADDQVIEELLDIGAAEALDSNIPGGFFTRITAGTLGGKRVIGKTADIIRSTPSRVIRRGGGRLIPTMISEDFSKFNKE